MPAPAHYHELTDTPFDTGRIESLWASHAASAGLHRVLPDGRMDLIVRFRANARGRISGRRLIIAGPATRHTDIPVTQGDRFVGLRFQPGWGGACLGVAPAGLRDTVALDAHVAALLGDEDTADLLGAATAASLQDGLLALAHRRARRAACMPEGVALAIERMHGHDAPLALPLLAAAAKIGERSLRRHIVDRVGLTVSAFSAVLRFQRAMRMLADAGPARLAHVATACGYSDQAHMTREFRRHGGFTPGDRPPVTLVGMKLDGVAAIFNPG